MTHPCSGPFLGTPRFGVLKVPEGVTDIPENAFQQDNRIEKVVIPSSVRTIGSCAFNGCQRLHQVVFDEGVEHIGIHAFSNCPNLERLILPDSVKTFESSNLEAPVFNASGTALYFVPDKERQNFAVPAGVKRLAGEVFHFSRIFGEVFLPEGLESIPPRAFVSSRIRRVVIPASVQKVHATAFACCDHLEDITVLSKETQLEAGAFSGCRLSVIHGREDMPFEERLRLFWLSIIQPMEKNLPGNADANEPELLTLAKQCETGDTGAMMAMGDYFEKRGPEAFYSLAANAWRYRARCFGNPEGEIWMKSWLAAHPEQRLPVLFPTPLKGCFKENQLRHAGFLFFDDRKNECEIRPCGRSGVFEVSVLTGEDSSDEDGYGGRESYYSYWFTDENLARLPEVAVLSNYSNHDRLNHRDIFEARCAQAEEVIRRRKEKR